MKKLNIDEEVYIRVTFKIKRGAINKLIEFLKQNTKTFQYWWEEGKENDRRDNENG